MSQVIIIAVGVAASQRVTGATRLITCGTIALMACGIAVSGSRAPLVHLVLMAALIPVVIPHLALKFKTTLKCLLIAAVAAVVVARSPIAASVAERYATLLDPEHFVELWLGRVWFGVGRALENPIGVGIGFTAGLPGFLQSDLLANLPVGSIDSGYAAAGVELGIVGLACFAYFAVSVAAACLRAWRALQPSLLKDLLLGPALWALSYPIWLIVAPPQASLPSSIFFWLLVGMLIKAPQLQRGSVVCESASPFRGARRTIATAATSSRSRAAYAITPTWKSGRAHFRTR
jgi:hypothetical protein